jgi:hypothetical protein
MYHYMLHYHYHSNINDINKINITICKQKTADDVK